MIEPRKPDEVAGSPDEPQVSCAVCLKEVPLSEAHTAEAVDYVAHFCGLECYEKWRHQPEEEPEPPPGGELEP